MKSWIRKIMTTSAAMLLTAFAAQAADWSAFIIRNATTGGAAPVIEGLPDSSVEIGIFAAGQKVGLGTDLLNGIKVSKIATLHIDRMDTVATSGSLYAPYFNIWVTDGAGHYAVIANEPSDAEWAASRWDVSSWDFLKTKRCKVFETPGAGAGTSWLHTLVGKTPANLKFEDVANLTIAPPPAAYIQDPANAVGSGAPDEIGTSIARGFNWMFGDTAANYLSGGDGFIVANYSVTANTVDNITQGTSFTTIQAAIDAANSGDTITVAAGTYAAFGISKGVRVLGANAGIDPNTGIRGAETIVIGGESRISTTDPVVIDGLTLSGVNLNSYTANAQITYQYNIITNLPGNMFFNAPDALALRNNHICGHLYDNDTMLVAGDWNGTSGTVVDIRNNVLDRAIAAGLNLSSVSGTITANTFADIQYYGLLLANDTDVTVSGNRFTRIVNPDTSVATWGSGVRTYTPGPHFGMNVTGNIFADSYVGIGVRAGSDLAGKPVTIAGNTFIGNTTNIVNQGTTAIDISANYWGTATPDITTLVEGEYVFTSYYADAALTRLLSFVVSVDDDFDNATPNWGVTAFATVQEGVNATASGGTVNVAAGTYSGQVEITRPVEIVGAGVGQTVIKGVASMPLSYSISGGAANKPVVYVHDTDDVIISGVTVDGDGKGNTNYRIQGFGFRNAGGSVSNCAVIAVRDTPFSGNQHGIGIYGYNDNGIVRTLEVLNTTVTDFQKNAFALGGTNMIAVVRGCTVTGAGATAVTAQNGIQLAYGAVGRIENNNVSGIKYSPANVTACGVMLYDAGAGSTVSGNTVDAQTAIYAQQSPNVSITGNTMNNVGGLTDWAVFIYKSDNSIFSGNTIANSIESGLDVYDADNALVENNIFTGNVYGVAVAGNSQNAVIRNNTFTGNADGLIVEAGSTASAIPNYWGNVTGPAGAGAGSGDTITGLTGFSPWWEDAALTVLRYGDTAFVADKVIGPTESFRVYGEATIGNGTSNTVWTVDNGSLEVNGLELKDNAALIVRGGKLILNTSAGTTTIAGTFTIFDSWGSVYFNDDTELSGDTIALVSHLVFSNTVKLTVSGSLVLDGCVLEAKEGGTYTIDVKTNAALTMVRNEVLDCGSFTVASGNVLIKDNVFENGLTVAASAQGAKVFHNVFADLAGLIDNGTGTVLAADGWGNIAASGATRNNLSLNLAGADANGDIFIQPGEAVEVTMDLDGLAVPVSGLDALLGYNTRFFGDTGTVTGAVAPWTYNIYEGQGIYTNLGLDAAVYGKIDKSIGVDMSAPLDGTTNDATTLSVAFTSTDEEGITKVFFHVAASGDVPADTRLTSAPGGMPVYVSPFTMNSGYITIDGTAPLSTFFMGIENQNGTVVDVFNPSNLTEQGAVYISMGATDELSGLDASNAVLTVTHRVSGAPLAASMISAHTNAGEMATTCNWAVVVGPSAANGIYDVKAVIADRSGNTVTNTAVIEVNKTTLGISVKLEGAVTSVITRDVRLALTDVAGGVIASWVEPVVFSNQTGTVSLRQVPDGVAAVSADTDWTLRTKQTVTYDANGQGSVSLPLYGGDLNNDNLVDMLDFARLRYFWMTSSMVADINGDGAVNAIDYSLLRSNWYVSGGKE